MEDYEVADLEFDFDIQPYMYEPVPNRVEIDARREELEQPDEPEENGERLGNTDW
jgi:hypothetical protein